MGEGRGPVHANLCSWLTFKHDGRISVSCTCNNFTLFTTSTINPDDACARLKGLRDRRTRFVLYRFVCLKFRIDKPRLRPSPVRMTRCVLKYILQESVLYKSLFATQQMISRDGARPSFVPPTVGPAGERRKGIESRRDAFRALQVHSSRGQIDSLHAKREIETGG